MARGITSATIRRRRSWDNGFGCIAVLSFERSAGSGLAQVVDGLTDGRRAGCQRRFLLRIER